jgi:hypothetical protein
LATFNDESKDKLRRILYAYARRNKSLGYCQVKSLIVTLLIFLEYELYSSLGIAIYGGGGRFLVVDNNCGGSPTWVLFKKFDKHTSVP